MYLLNCENVLCIGAYPGDVEYSIFGTIIKKYRTNFTIIVLEETSESNKKELQGVWGGIQNLRGQFGDLKNINLKPDLIITCSNNDLDSKRRETYQIGLNKFLSEGVGFCTYKTVTGYESNFNFYCDITGQYNKKSFILQDIKPMIDEKYLEKTYMNTFNSNNIYSNLFDKKVESLNIIGYTE